MSVKDIVLQSESPTTQAHHKIKPVSKLASSQEGDHKEQLADLASDDEDPQAIQRSSRASSLCDDSGFNSSASEDRDDIIDKSLRKKCDFDSDKSLIRSLGTQGHNTQNSLLKDHIQCSEQSNIPDLFIHNVKNSSVEMKISNSTVSQEKSDSVSNQCHASNISDNASVNGNIPIRNTDRISRRQRTATHPSQAAPGAPVTPRIPRSRRHRSRDLNNNDSAHKDLNSYLSTPPFKLQDCFQNQGILSLIACITYTVVLMIICCLLGVICDYVKSVVGKQNLRDLRADIVHSRHTRTNMASG